MTPKSQKPDDAKQPGVVTDGWNLQKRAKLPGVGFNMRFWLLHSSHELQDLCSEMPSER